MEGETSGKMSTSTTTTKIIANTTTTTTTTTTIYNHIFSNTIPNDLACNKLLKSSLFHGVSDVVAEGELVLLYAGYDGIFPITLKRNKYHNCKYGHFAHNDIIGKIYGSRIESKKGNVSGRVYVLKVTPNLWAKAVTLRTQIIQPSDQAVIISMLCIRSGSIVVESGTGSGAFTISLAQTVAPHGQVYTFEFNKDRVNKIYQDMKLLGIESVVTATHGDACAEKGFSIVETGSADAVMLDVPNPWLAINNAKRCLKIDGRVCTYSPCIEQVQKNCIALKEKGFHSIKTIEVRLRNYSVKEDNIVVPDFEPLRVKYDPNKRQKLLNGDQVDKKTDDEEGDINNSSSSKMNNSNSSNDVNKSNIINGDINDNTSQQHNKVNKHIKFSKKRKRHASSHSSGTKTIIRARPFSNTRGHTAFLTFAIKMP